MNGKMVIEAQRRARPASTRVGFRAALQSLYGLDVEIGVPVNFGPERYQRLDGVDDAYVAGNGSIPIGDRTGAVEA